MQRYTIDPGGFWRLYHPKPVPEGWQMLGTFRCWSDDSIGALGRSPAGLFAQINADGVRLLDQRAAADALRRVRLPPDLSALEMIAPALIHAGAATASTRSR